MHKYAFVAAFLLCSGYVFARGGQPERAAMFAQWIAVLLSAVSIFVLKAAGFSSVPVLLMIVDVLLCLALSIIAVAANRYWPIVLAGFQVATLLAHLAKATFAPMPPTGYAILIQFWAWPMLAVTGVGAANHRRRVRRSGLETDWKNSWLAQIKVGLLAH